MSSNARTAKAAKSAKKMPCLQPPASRLPPHDAIHTGDCVAWLRTLPDESMDACVTDPPYELGFMGKHWDASGIAYRVEMWREAFRVLKPGAHLLSFGGTRTYHRMACAIEDAGFEIRDQIMWLYGSGFPKSLDVSKAIDKAAGAERERIGTYHAPEGTSGHSNHQERIGTSPQIGGLNRITAPATDAAKGWSGWGTALKPAHEPICVARKLLAEKTVAANVLAHGTGGINVDGCRIQTGASPSIERRKSPCSGTVGWRSARPAKDMALVEQSWKESRPGESLGRWPANVALDEAAARELDAQSGKLTSGTKSPNHIRHVQRLGQNAYGADAGGPCPREWPGDTGCASRFFYCAKASRREREAGLEALQLHNAESMAGSFQNERPHTKPGYKYEQKRLRNHHPTVKPIALMRWLVRLVTPPDGVVLDPFAGSGTTCIAAVLEGFHYLACEQDPEYVAIAEARIAHWRPKPLPLFAEASG